MTLVPHHHGRHEAPHVSWWRAFWGGRWGTPAFIGVLLSTYVGGLIAMAWYLR